MTTAPAAATQSRRARLAGEGFYCGIKHRLQNLPALLGAIILLFLHRYGKPVR